MPFNSHRRQRGHLLVKRATAGKGAAGRAATPKGESLPFGPAITFPITAAFVLTPAVMFVFAPTPIIGVNSDVCIRWIFVSLVAMPADRADAGDGCRGIGSGGQENAGHCCSHQETLSQTLGNMVLQRCFVSCQGRQAKRSGHFGTRFRHATCSFVRGTTEFT